jgi:GT2 family glycosyltransferase
MKNVFVAVNYNHIEETRLFIESYIQNCPNDCDNLYIVDNSECKAKCRELENELVNINVKFLYPRNNLGYMGAGSFALDYHFNNYGIDFEYFCLMNNDISFCTNEFSNALLNDKNRGYMLISPVVIDNGKSVNPYMVKRKSLSYMCFWNFALIHYRIACFIHFLIDLLTKHKKNKKIIKNRCLTPTKVYGTHGSIFILNKSFFIQGGRLDKLPFLYGEEMYISEQIRKIGGDCLFNPEIEFSHVGSATLGKIYSVFKYECIKEAHKFLYKEFYK